MGAGNVLRWLNAEGSKPVLVADADDAGRAELARLLEEADHQVVQVASGREALDKIRALTPCLALLEIQLADDVCGYEVCRTIRELHGEAVPVIFVSGSRTEPYDRVAGLLLGADDYVVKPYASDELLTRIRNLLRRSSGRGLPESVVEKLTRREREVLQLLAEGLRKDEIAIRMFISTKTVGTHLTNLCRKLDVHSQAQAVALAFREELVASPEADNVAAEPPALA
jgi:DNA-binding NarL/FixJ family response regulator